MRRRFEHFDEGVVADAVVRFVSGAVVDRDFGLRPRDSRDRSKGFTSPNSTEYICIFPANVLRTISFTLSTDCSLVSIV